MSKAGAWGSAPVFFLIIPTKALLLRRKTIPR